MMSRRFSLITAIFSALMTITVVADEQENIITEELVSLLEKLGKLLKEKDYDNFRAAYPEFINALNYWKDYELVKERSQINNLIENTNEEQVSTLSNDDMSDFTAQFLPAWLNTNAIKRKRAYHRALCHFKLCNMGSKRSRFYWSMARRRNT